MTQLSIPTFDTSIFEIVDGHVNLTRLCTAFKKDINEFKRLPSVQAFLSALESDMGESPIRIIRGFGVSQGTFGTREVALKVAQWISPEFEVWSIKQLDNLLQNRSHANTLTRVQLAQMVIDIEEEKKALQSVVTKQEKTISEQNTLNTQIIESKAKETKTGLRAVKEDLGAEINAIIKRLYPNLNHRDQHLAGRNAYLLSTGKQYLGAKLTSLESKKDYLEFLKTQLKD